MLPPDESHEFPSRAEIFGLATLAGHAGTRRDLRIKAIRALARIPDQNAIHVLAEMALWEEDEGLRQEAYRALETTFGDDLPEVLEGIRLELTGQTVLRQAQQPVLRQAQQPVLRQAYNLEPADREASRREGQQPMFQPNQQPVEGTPLWLLWVLVGIVVIGGLVILAVMR